MDKDFISYAIGDRSYLAFIKREIHNKILQENFGSLRAAEIDIIVSELTSNLIKHAGSGELLYRITSEDESTEFEVICIDNGTGIENVPLMMKDHTSTTNTLGNGLGAIQRLSDVFQIFSLREWGTIAYSKVVSKKPAIKKAVKKSLFINALSVPLHGQMVSGDGFAIKKMPHETQIFFCDGLGHGEHAHSAMQQAVAAFYDCTENVPSEILRYIHTCVKRTRGLVGTVAIFNYRSGKWRICGVGNILTRLYSGLSFRNYNAYNGIIGLNIPNTLTNYETDGDNKQYLIMCSDGIRTRWDLAKYYAVFKYDPMVLAAILYKDFSRKNDDASVLIGKLNI